MRQEALRIFMAGVQAADPTAAVTAALQHDMPRPAFIVAIGKAAGVMAQPAMAHYPGVLTYVVTNYENAQDIDGATVFAAGHPVPDQNGADAAARVVAALQQAKGPILALISGGGSALLPAPASGLCLADKVVVSQLLLGAGLPINQMNLVRQQLSDLKGGGFLRHAAPQPVVGLILSDVIGDDLSAIASGLTAPPIGTAEQAVDILQGCGVWGQVPLAVRQYLGQGHSVVPTPEAMNILVGSNPHSVAAMRGVAGDCDVIAEPVTGDVRHAARLICDHAKRGITLWGGETTVALKGHGRGGRNQELALWIAKEAAARGWSDWTCLQAGTDGRDGPTDAAGAIVDDKTLSNIRNLQIDIDAILAQNDSYSALKATGDLLITGATGTNVADLGVLIRKG